MVRRNRIRLGIESLETRIAPAALIGANKVTYQDLDGDNVAVVLSKPILSTGDVHNVFIFNTAFPVTGPQQLEQIDLGFLGGAAKGVSITLTATRSPVNGGDGYAAVGEILANSVDLGIIRLDGDLGRIVAGDGNPTSAGLGALRVQSMGRHGLATGASSLSSSISGRLGVMVVEGDMRNASIGVTGGMDGNIGSVFIGGSLFSHVLTNGGRIDASGGIGSVRVLGDVAGGTGMGSGGIFASKIGSIFVGGSLRGGDGQSSGKIETTNLRGSVTIQGSVVGAGGANSGVFRAAGRVTGITIGGSLLGGTGIASGRVEVERVIGTTTIRGDVIGDGGDSSGSFFSAIRMGSFAITGSTYGGSGNGSGNVHIANPSGPVRMGGSILGGSGIASGWLGMSSTGQISQVHIGGSIIGGTDHFAGSVSLGRCGRLTVHGDVVGGSASGNAGLQYAGVIEAIQIGALTIRGSVRAGVDDTNGTFVRNGGILSAQDIRSIRIHGGLIGNPTHAAVLSAGGQFSTATAKDVAIGSIFIGGRVEYGHILAGVATNGDPINADAQIGAVFVAGSWIASSIAAGVDPVDGHYGNANDQVPSGAAVKNDAAMFSHIGSIVIVGEASGTNAVNDHFGFLAQSIGKFRVRGTPFPLTAAGDNLPVGITGDVRVYEL